MAFEITNQPKRKCKLACWLMIIEHWLEKKYKMIRLLILLLAFVQTMKSYSQSIEKIKFAKNADHFFFFQKGLKSDTIIKNVSDKFYLLVPDSLKAYISITVENGRLQKTSNDSLLVFEYLSALKYETFYVPIESQQNSMIADKKRTNDPKNFELKTLINGSCERENNTILIRIINKKDDHLMIENLFYYKR